MKEPGAGEMQIKLVIDQVTVAISQVFPVISQIKEPGAGEMQIKLVIGQVTEVISQVFPVISQIKSSVLEKCK